MDVLFRIGHLHKQKLRDHDVRHLVVNRRANEKDAAHQQPRIKIETPFAATRLFYHNRNVIILHGRKILHFRRK